MRFIPTTSTQVDALKKRAKRQGRNTSGKHTELLDVVAKAAGYDHWHHVMECQKETERVYQGRSLSATIEHIVALEHRGEVAIVGTGTEASTAQPFLVFSTGVGDAWLLDPVAWQACCLVWRGDRQSPVIRDLPERLEIQWEGTFELVGEFFEVDLDHKEIGRRAIAGYPVDQLRTFLLPIQSPEHSIRQLFGQEDAVPLSPDVIQRLSGQGWSSEELEKIARQGARYSPARNTVLFPPMKEPKL